VVVDGPSKTELADLSGEAPGGARTHSALSGHGH
jgi:hypothetical protein